MIPALLSGVLLVVILATIIFRPKNINVAWPAGIGAVFAIIFGLIPLSALETVFIDTWDATITLIALFFLAETLNANKFFDWAALHLAIKSSGSGWKLYIYTLLLTTLATAFLANDGAILILTPIFATLLKKIYPNSRKDWLPYIFAAGFFADAMSATFIPSNLTNILLADAFHLDFGTVFLQMAVPMIIAFIIGGAAFGLRFKKRLETPYSLKGTSNPEKLIKDWVTFWIGIIVLITLVLGYILGGQFHLPTALVALPLSLIMLVVVHTRKLIKVQEVINLAPWSILIYALGMFIVITAAYNNHMLRFITQPLIESATSNTGIFFVGGLVGGLAAVVNNLPATLISILSLRSVPHVAHLTLYGVLLGVNIGPKLTPFGSLSTLLWLSLLAKNGVTISWKEYFKENWWVTILVLSASLIGLYLTSFI